MLQDRPGRLGSNRGENLVRFLKFLVPFAASGFLAACMAPMQASAPPPMMVMQPQAAAAAAPPPTEQPKGRLSPFIWVPGLVIVIIVILLVFTR